MKKSRKQSLEKKMAAAISIVNLLNAAAPIALPYVTVTRDIGAAGATTESLSDAAARALYGTAEATDTVVHSGETSTVHILSPGDTQTIESGGKGLIIFTNLHDGINYGTQIVQGGGFGEITSNSGTQVVEGGGKGDIAGNYGTQVLQQGASGNADVIYNNGSQDIQNGAKGRVGTLEGTQTVEGGGTGYVKLIAGGQQIINQNATGSAAEITSSGGIGYQKINNGTGTADLINAGGEQDIFGGLGTVNLLSSGGQQGVYGGVGTVTNMKSGGTQKVTSGGTGVITTMDGGTQMISSTGQTASGMIETMNSGEQQVSADCVGLVKVMSGGQQLVSAKGVGTVNILSGGHQVIKSGGTGLLGAMAGGTLMLEPGAKVSGTLSGYGTVNGGTGTVTGGGVLKDIPVVVSGGTMKFDALYTDADDRPYGERALTMADGGTLVATKGVIQTEGVKIATDVTKGVLISGGDRVTLGTIDFTSATASKPVKDFPIVQGGTLTPVVISGYIPTWINYGDTAISRQAHETTVPKEAPALTIGYDTEHTVKLYVNRLTYTVQNTCTDATFNGTVSWDPLNLYFDANDYLFTGAVPVDLAALNFSFTNDWAKNLAAGQSMPLFYTPSGKATISAAAPTSFPVSYSGANTVLSGTVTGSASIGTYEAGDAVKYTLSSVTLDKVDVKGVSTETEDKVPNGWAKNPAGVSVDTSNLSVNPDNLSGSYPLLTANSSYFSDSNISGPYRYIEKADLNHEKNGVTLAGSWSRGVRAADDGKSLEFYSGALHVDNVSFGKMAWGTPRTLSEALHSDFTGAVLDATNLSFTNLDTSIMPGRTTELLTGAGKLAAGTSVAGAAHRQDFSAAARNGVVFGATLAGSVSTAANTVRYMASSVTLNDITLAGWDGTSCATPVSWGKKSSGVTVNTDNMNFHPEDLANQTTNILNGPAGFFSNASLTGSNVYANGKAFDSTRKGVALSGTWSRGVDVENGGKDLVFRAGKAFVDNIALGTIPWTAGASLRPNAGTAGIDYTNVSGVDTTNFSVANPADAAPGESITLLTANNTLKDIAAEEAKANYSYSPVAGVTVDGSLTGDLEAKGGNLTFTVFSNEASNLTFRNVNWTGDNALMARPRNITFNGAQVDTSKITFTNVSTLKKGDVTTLVSSFGGNPSAIVGDKYRIGTTFEGDGHASVAWNDLIFTVESEPRASEQTHNALMGAGAGMVVLSAGNDAIGNATGGLGQASNTGSDGVSTYAQMGGGSTRQETGSHIDVHSWNAILALGHKNEKEKSAFEYGAFFEYGTGNYTTHNGDLRGDGSMRYTGGGLLAKWTAKHGFYVEGSLRGGSIHGETNGVLRDVNDNPFSYESDAPYWGAHIGVGRELDLGHNNTLDVYGKYFMNRRNGVDFTAGEGHYDLDALTSHILRVGARYTMKREKWDFYGGLAYEHELDGKASGTVSNGVLSASIRGTDPTGGSVRMELGATMKPENSPWSLDVNLAGFAGKKRGFSGGMSFAWMF